MMVNSGARPSAASASASTDGRKLRLTSVRVDRRRNAPTDERRFRLIVVSSD
jgi:hypothetical protein